MSSDISIPSALRIAAQEIALSIRDGRPNDAAITDFIEQTKSQPLTKIAQYESAIRRASYVNPAPKQMSWHRRPSAHRFAISWFDMFSYDGFRREQAIRTTTSGAPNSFLLAVLLRRLNDWVPQVREAARESVGLVLSRTDVEIVSEVAWVTLPVRSSWRRLDRNGELVLDTIADRPEVASALASKILSASSGPAAAVLRQACRHSSLDGFLPQLALTAIEPAVRALAYRMLLEQEAKWHVGWQWRWTNKSLGERVREPKLEKRTILLDIDFISTLQSAIKDRSASVRRVAGDTLVKKRNELGSLILPMARQIASDEYPSIAQRGQFILDKLETSTS